MFWVQFFIALAFTVVGELLRPKPKFDAPRPTSLGDYRAPTADEVRPIPVAYGTVKITGPNAVWWGDFEARPITKKVKTGLFSSDRITLGYQYWLGLQLALCWGTVDELIGVEFDEKQVTLFNRVNGTDVVSFNMDQPDLLSADEPSNGVKGAVKFYRGTFTQTPNQYLAAEFGEFTIPAYRGVCYAVFEKCYLSNNDSVPPVAWIVRRTPNTLGLTGGRENINGDANPACALFEVMTNTFWGAAVPQGAIDTNSFVSAANTLHAEGLGISMLIDTAGTADGIMGEILRHIDGVIFIDPETGKFTLKLARNDYVVASLPLLDPSNITADSFKYTRGSWDETKNTVKIKYIDREQRYTERVVQHQNLANISVRSGQVDADDFDFSGLSNPTAANAVAARVLKTVSSPLSRVECEVNRTQFGLRPGSVFRLSWPQLGVAQVVYRVVEIDYGTLESGVFRIRAVEDVFSVAAVSFINPPGSGWQNPFGPVSPATRQAAFEVPYAMQATPSGDRYIATTASPARPSDIGYRVWQDPSGGSTFVQGTTNTFTFTPNGTLVSSLAQNTASNGVTLTVGNGYGFDRLVAPTTEEANAGNAICRIVSGAGEELISFTGLTVTGTTCTLTGVTRGIYDTVPLTHPAGAVVWFVSEGVGFTQDTPYVGDGATRIRLLPYNQRESLALASATNIDVTRTSRALEPYPPGGPLLNSSYLPEIITGPLTVSWSHRDRVLQGRTPISQQNGSVGPEASTTYTLRLYDENNVLRRTYSGLTGTSQVWDTEETDCNLFDGSGTGFTSVRDGCIHYYGFEESSGLTIRDIESTSPINLTLSGGTLAQPSIRTGGARSTQLTGTNRAFTATAPAEIMAATRLSMSAWVRFSAWSTTSNTICIAGVSGSESEASNFRMHVRTDANRRLQYVHEYGAGVDEVVTASAMTPLALNTNYHIAVVQDRVAASDGTQSILNFNGTDGSTTFTDLVGNTWAIASGSPTISTAQSVFGGASGRFSGTARITSTMPGQIAAPNAGGTFCVEFRIRLNSTTVGNVFTIGATTSDAPVTLRISSGGVLQAATTGTLNTLGTLTVGVWYHVAVSRDASGLALFFLDGVSVSSQGGSNRTTTSPIARIGSDGLFNNNSADFWIDDFRWTYGQQRYTGTFTPPASQLALATSGANEIRFYVNGALVDTQTYTNVPTGGTSVSARLVIGSDNDGGNSATSVNGRVQDVIFTNDLLTASDVTWLYNGGAGRGVLDVLGQIPRLNNRVRIELESVRGGLTSFTRHNYTVQRAGQQTQINPLPGTLNFLGNLPSTAVVGTPISVQFQPGGLAGSAVWSIEPAVAGATISGVGLLSFNAPAAGSYTINVKLTDHPSLASVTRAFTVLATTVAATPATNAFLGAVPNGYAGVPYYALASQSNSTPNDGLVTQRTGIGNVPWYTRTSGLPTGISIVDPFNAHIAGVPLAAGSFPVTVSGGPNGVGATALSTTAIIYPTPSFTVLNPFDRIFGNDIQFVNNTAPLLTVKTAGQYNGRARTINGMATADTPRYWEVTIGALGTGALTLGAGVSASRGLVGSAGSRLGMDDGDWGYEIERPFAGADLRAFISGRSFTPYTVGVPVANTGVTLRFASRQNTAGPGRRLWIAVENGPWIGGGDPVANTTPTIDSMVIPGNTFWNDYRPALYLNGDCEATANFGSQPWKYAAPSGHTGIAYALPINATTENGWNNETESLVAGTTPPPPTRQDRSESRGTLLTWGRMLGFPAPYGMNSPSSLLAFAPKTTGKWQFEVFSESGYSAVSGAGLVPNDWQNKVAAGLDMPVPGATADSLGVRFATGLEPGGSTDGEVRVNNAVLGSFTRLQANDVLTFACDFDARTVALYRAGTLVGTYTLPVTGKPWAICAFGGQWGGAVLRTRSLAHPQAGFSNWTITGA